MELSENIKIKTKNNFIFSHFWLKCVVKRGGGGEPVRERKCNFSLDFSAFESSVLVGLRSKVVLRYKGYAWTSILWSFDNSKR